MHAAHAVKLSCGRDFLQRDWQVHGDRIDEGEKGRRLLMRRLKSVVGRLRTDGLTVALTTAFVMTISAAFAHPPGVKDEDQAAAHEVESFREFIKRAVDKKDVHALRALYAESFTHTHGSGRIDGKDTRIVSVMAGDPVIENAPAEELLYRVFGNHTIIVTGKSPILNKAENRSYHFRWIAVYVKVGMDWKVAASQATRLP
jgi:hypothetical protein